MAQKLLCDTTDLCSVTFIAEYCDISNQAVFNWVRRFEDFPEEVEWQGDDTVYYWPDVLAWLKENGKV